MKKVKVAGIVLVVLGLALIGSGFYLNYQYELERAEAEALLKEKENKKEEDKKTEIEDTKEETVVEEEEANDENKITELVISGVVDRIEFPYPMVPGRAHIMLGGVERELQVEIEGFSITLKMDGIAFEKYEKISVIEAIYVLNEELLLVVTGGTDIRGTKYFFYNPALQKVDIDMSLDSNYPVSMARYTSKGMMTTMTVENNVITIWANRIAHGDLLLEDNSRISICGNDGTIIPEVYAAHKGEVTSAVYQLTYLGNYQFEKKQIEVLGRLDESICQ